MSEATVTLGKHFEGVVRSEGELQAALVGLEQLDDGEVASLKLGPKSYIRAKRYGLHWSVTKRNGSFLTLASFTADMTTEYSERTVREAREIRSLWDRARTALRRVPEHNLSTAQVRTLFGEFLGGRKFTIPQAGA